MVFFSLGDHVIVTLYNIYLTEQRRLPMQRATYEYLKGKILDVVPEYKKDAEDHLSKAVCKNTLLILVV